MPENKKKNILVIGTGGTIAGIGNEGETLGYNSAQIKVDKLVSGIPSVSNLANITSVELFSIDSCDMSLEKLIKLSKYIENMAKKEDVDGFVITHGTDTLEETAYFLNLTVHTEKPIVITGAMRPGTALSADGPFNLYQAVALAANNESKSKGVMVAFSDAIYGARDVTKVNTFKTNAFSQKDMGSMGYIRDNKVYFYNCSVKRNTVNSEFEIFEDEKLPNVEIINFYLGANKKVLDYISQNADGVVLGGAGCGGASEEWNKEISKMIKSGIPVVRSSRIANSLVTFKDGEISEKGVYAGNLSPQKARILLMLALTKTKNLLEIQNMFNEY